MHQSWNYHRSGVYLVVGAIVSLGLSFSAPDEVLEEMESLRCSIVIAPSLILLYDIRGIHGSPTGLHSIDQILWCLVWRTYIIIRTWISPFFWVKDSYLALDGTHELLISSPWLPLFLCPRTACSIVPLLQLFKFFHSHIELHVIGFGFFKNPYVELDLVYHMHKLPKSPFQGC